MLNMISSALPGVLLLNGAASVGASLWTDRSFAWLVLLAAALAQTTASYVIHGLSTEVYIPSKYLGFCPRALYDAISTLEVLFFVFNMLIPQ